MIASDGYKLLPLYKLNPETSMWTYIGDDNQSTSPVDLWNFEDDKFECPGRIINMKKLLSKGTVNDKDRYLKKAAKLFREVEKKGYIIDEKKGGKKSVMSNKTELSRMTEEFRWFVLPEEVMMVSSSSSTVTALMSGKTFSKQSFPSIRWC